MKPIVITNSALVIITFAAGVTVCYGSKISSFLIFCRLTGWAEVESNPRTGRDAKLCRDEKNGDQCRGCWPLEEVDAFLIKGLEVWCSL